MIGSLSREGLSKTQSVNNQHSRRVSKSCRDQNEYRSLSRDAGFPTGDVVEIELKRIIEKTNNPKPIQTALKRRKPTTKQELSECGK